MDEDQRQTTGDEPEAPAGELAPSCTLCRAIIPAEFFTLRGLLLCPECAERVRQRQTGRDNLRRALLFGAVAAAVLALLWYLATTATSRQLSWLAVLAGVVIGLAVHQGSGGRGGWRYQLAAMLLVYATFIVRYIPPVFGGITDAIKREHATTAIIESRAPAQPPGAPAPAAGDRVATAPNPPAPAEQTSTLATFKAYFVFTVIAWGLVLAAPFMPGTTGVFTLVSLALGMALAFRLNRRVPLRGPFTAAG